MRLCCNIFNIKFETKAFCQIIVNKNLEFCLDVYQIKKICIFSGISSLVFTKDAQALYLHSSSEFQRISLAATAITMARCYLPLPSTDRDIEGTSDAGSDHRTNETLENSTDTPLVNGTAESKDGSVADKVVLD